MPKQVFNNCKLEFDGDINGDTGVLYVHDLSTGTTILRICGMDRIDVPFEQVDITIAAEHTYVQYLIRKGNM